MTAHWIAVAAARHVAIAVADGFAMFSHGRLSAARRVHPGDWVAYYCPREGLGEGEEVRAFTAIGTVLDGEPGEREMGAAHTGWSRRMRWLDGRRADVYPLLERFSFVKDRSHWGIYFRKSLFAASAEDLAIVADAMGVGGDFRHSNRS